jgi:hypothetical protein
LPRLFLPIKTIGDAELHDGGSTSFTVVFLLKGIWVTRFRRRMMFPSVASVLDFRMTVEREIA